MLKIIQNGKIQEIAALGDKSILAALQAAGLTGVHAPCGGNGTCKQCTAHITGRLLPVGGGDAIVAENEPLLCCRWIPDGDAQVILPDTEKLDVLTTGAGNIRPCGEKLGVSVDIGTTTVASFLYDLSTGEQLAVDSGRNVQRAYGADVISRIQYSAGEGGLERLQTAIRDQLSVSIDRLCKAAKRNRNEIELVSIAGNTVMAHLFDGLSPVGIGVAPFTPESLFGDHRPAAGLLDGLAPDAQIYMCPALAGYVGGDITAGLLSSDAWQEEAACLFIDIGTNGEMGLGDKNGFLCCATAAGPAFEGAEIECGMGGAPGAINTVSLEDGEIRYTVLGDEEAVGICGSGLIDALAVMLRCGVVEGNGRMIRPEEADECYRARLQRGEDGGMRFYLTDKVYVSAADVRQLQLAKAAIRAGIETLLAQRGEKYADICHVLIAGGFGAYMDVKSACGIGLLPPALLRQTRHVGNSAGAGATLALDAEQQMLLQEITDKCDYLELSSSAMFMEKYIECMVFDEIEEVF
ncbi:MAG: DUF4445 domain-containing protein [Oscillospiraceae bacterium]|nr:DUF4445 domain-containing protein [Oscillospiraceae bacterium]